MKKILSVTFILFLLGTYAFADESIYDSATFADVGLSYTVGGHNSLAFHFGYIGFPWGELGTTFNTNWAFYGEGIAGGFAIDMLFGFAYAIKINNDLIIPLGFGVYWNMYMKDDFDSMFGPGINASYYHPITDLIYVFGRIQVAYCIGTYSNSFIFSPVVGVSFRFGGNPKRN